MPQQREKQHARRFTTAAIGDTRPEEGRIQSKRHKIIYLACPYSHPDHIVREKRFRLATDAAAKLIEQGHIIYSPITMTHPIDVVLAEDTQTLGSDYWVQFDEAFMAVCAEIVVLQVEGWDQSRGIQREIEYFQMQGRPVTFLPMDKLRTF